jgi:hypothetical protein
MAWRTTPKTTLSPGPVRPELYQGREHFAVCIHHPRDGLTGVVYRNGKMLPPLVAGSVPGGAFSKDSMHRRELFRLSRLVIGNNKGRGAYDWLKGGHP